MLRKALLIEDGLENALSLLAAAGSVLVEGLGSPSCSDDMRVIEDCDLAAARVFGNGEPPRINESGSFGSLSFEACSVLSK